MNKTERHDFCHMMIWYSVFYNEGATDYSHMVEYILSRESAPNDHYGVTAKTAPELLA